MTKRQTTSNATTANSLHSGYIPAFDLRLRHEPRDYGDFLTDIVTYEGSSDDGTAMFSFQSRDDLPLQRLASSIKLPSDIVAGQRIPCCATP